MTARSGWLLLLLFFLSFGIGNLQPRARTEQPSAATPSPQHEVFPYALLKWRVQTHHQITLPQATPAELDLPDFSDRGTWVAPLFEAAPHLLPSADPLYLLMSLQR
jgi:hypothetical protein